MTPDSVKTCCATAALGSCTAANKTHVNFHRFRTWTISFVLQITEDQNFSLKFQLGGSILTRPSDDYLPPGRLALFNIAHSWVRPPDKYR
jgi:hypothetical protein